MTDRFDIAGFFGALDAVRRGRGLTWKDVAAESGVNASTLTRMGQGKNPDLNGLAGLLAWSGLKAEMFIPEIKQEKAEAIGRISTILRADRSLSRNSAKVMEDIVLATYRSLRERQK